jgi:YGGT family
MERNPYQDEHAKGQAAKVLPQQMEMEDLQPRKATPPPAQTTPTMDTIPEGESAETRLEEARTVRYAIGKLNDFLQWFMAVLEISLAIRFLLKLIGADPTNLFAGFCYALTEIILFPFMSIVGNPSLHKNQYFEISTLIGMAIYYLLFWAIRRFLRILISGPEEPAT